jgi:hypothetical protein
MSTIFMDINPVSLGGEAISCYMLPLVDNHTTLAMVSRNSSERRSKASCSNYEEI